MVHLDWHTILSFTLAAKVGRVGKMCNQHLHWKTRVWIL